MLAQYNYTVERVPGLSHNTVTSILPDSHGYIWISTIDGLNRFDGYEARVYKHNPDDRNSISSSFVHNVFEDRSGNLWISTRDGGLNRWDRETDQFTAFKCDPRDPKTLSDNKTGGVVEGHDGVLWIATDGGVSRLDQRTGETRRYVHSDDDPSSIAGNEVTGLLLDSTGSLWVSSDNGLSILDTATGKARTIHPAPAYTGLSGTGKLLQIVKASDGTIWVGSRVLGLATIDAHGDLAFPYRPVPGDDRTPASEFVSPMHEDEEGNIWLATHDGLQLFERATGTFHRISLGPASGIPGSSTLSGLAVDRAGDLWVGTWGAGVYHICRARQKFRPEHLGLPGSGSTGDFVLSFGSTGAGTDSRLWVGTGRGIGILRLEGAGPVSHALDNTVVWTILNAGDGTVWAGTDGAGIAVLNSNGGIVRSIVPRGGERGTVSGLNDRSVRALFKDSRGTIWVGTQNHGAMTFNPGSGKWTSIYRGRDSATGAPGATVWAINEDHSGRIWLGSYRSGLLIYDTATGSMMAKSIASEGPYSPAADDIRCICITRTGAVWIGTYGEGIFRWDEHSGKFEQFSSRQGLANNFVYGVVEDELGTLWISTNLGVSRFFPAERRFRSYSVADGLQADEFNTGAFFKGPNGLICFGGVAGFNRFHPESIRDNTRPVSVVLTSFKVFESERSFGRPLDLVRAIELRYDENYFSFEFAGLDFVDVTRNQYAYMLEGFDPHWNQSGARRYGSYTNLDPGTYTLRVKASNSDGIWNEEGIRVRLTVVPPFWLTVWFRVAGLLFLAAAFAGAVRFISTRKLREQVRLLEQERQLQRERERISRDLHDNVGAQLSTIIAGLELAGRQSAADSEKRQGMLGSLKDDARHTMSQLRETIWAMSSSSMKIGEFFETLESYARKALQARRRPSLEFVLDAPPTVTLSPMQTLHLYRVFQEALNNAMKYADADCIAVSLRLDGSGLTLAIADDGKGLTAGLADPLSGRGMLNMDRRAKELGGKFEFLTGSGATVRVTVPLDEKYLN